ELALCRRREFEKRRDSIIENLGESGALTPELQARFENAATMTEIEDLYAPYKPKRRTRAAIAREKGLEPLAKRIMAGRATRLDASAEDIAGACDIIAEWAAETPRLRNIVRREFRKRGNICASVTKDKAAEIAASPYAEYNGFDRPLRRCSSHQYLALRRAEREGFLKVKYNMPDDEAVIDALCGNFGPREATEACGKLIDDSVADAYKRLLRPSVENELAAEMKEEADKVAIGIFSDNLRALLLAAPLPGRRVLAIDPGYRTGCKVVAIDAQGNLLADTVIYPTEPRCDTEGARKTLAQLIDRYRLDTVALGDGTASRQTEDFLRKSGLVKPDSLYVVSENGASVYSASDIARREFPDKDVTVRGAVSIGRRLIDPLAELVKIDPKSIGVGQYQHDVDQTGLRDALDYTVM
ncbi:MAG: RNA-binding transcriptional accessory protein, partial [Muribaculaceae bacterium]|nr:RNA-binding transcriptional accessory protein [Muribaculaceae bacterium]